MSADERRAIIRRFHSSLEETDTLYDEVLTADFVGHLASGQQMNGASEFKQYAQVMLRAFSDLHSSVHEIVGDGDLFACRVSFSGTHSGDLMGIPPTNKRFELTEAIFVRFEGNKIAEEWQYVNQLAMFQQLGINPTGEASE
ncbi:MAG TPA: ester cyclase [Acidimicrobiia bacterium]|nr:ester cyclase [Acidimicrobiia bacterium]